MDVSGFLSELEIALKNDYLDSYIQGLDLSVIIELRNYLAHDVLTNNKNVLLQHLDDELEFRCLNNYVSKRDSSFLSDKFDFKMNEEAKDEVKRSIDLLNSLGIPLNMVKWVPAFLYLDKAFQVYSYLKVMKRSQSEIDKVFLASFDTFMKIAERTQLKEEYQPFYDEFINYIVYLSHLVTSKKSVTESYQKYTQDILNKNQELLRRLS